MATFTYKCRNGHAQDLRFPVGLAPAEAPGFCPLCEEEGVVMERVFTPPTVIFGDGFRKPWADKPQKSKEADERFFRGGRD